MPYHFHITDWSRNELALRSIREEVFLQEQQVPEADEWDNQDSTAVHFLVRNDSGQAIACARLISEIKNNQQVFHIGRVAVLKPYRNLTIGRQLMQFVVAYCQTQNSLTQIYLQAQTSRQVFYQHLHFQARGEIFMDANIPHIEMWYIASKML